MCRCKAVVMLVHKANQHAAHHPPCPPCAPHILQQQPHYKQQPQGLPKPCPRAFLPRPCLPLPTLESRLLNRCCICGSGGQVCSCGCHACQRLSAVTHGLRVRHQLHRVHISAASGLRLCAPAKGAWLPCTGNTALHLCPSPPGLCP